MGSTEESVRRSARVLTGFMTPQEASGFATSFVLSPPPFIAEWQRQTAARGALAASYTVPKLEEPPASAQAHIASLRANPLFTSIYPNAEIKMVELGKLIAFQHWVDVDVSDGVHGAGVQGPPDESQILARCLPLEIISAARTLWQPIQNGVAVYTLENSFNVARTNVDQASGVVTIVLSAGANLMLVREHAGRYVLANGYHRAWLLRSRGVEMVPVVILHMANQADVVPPAGFISPQVLFGPRPPLVDDFLDDALSVRVEVRAMMKAVKITAEASMVPRFI